MKSVSLTLALLCSASIVLADVKITTKSTAGGQSITSTTYIKGAPQRTEGMREVKTVQELGSPF